MARPRFSNGKSPKHPSHLVISFNPFKIPLLITNTDFRLPLSSFLAAAPPLLCCVLLCICASTSMELQKRQDQGLPQRKGQKRKLEEEIKDEQPGISPSPVASSDARRAILSEVAVQVSILDSAFSWQEADRAAAKRATHVLADLAKNGGTHFSLFLFPCFNEVVNVIVEGGAVPALVKHLQSPPITEVDGSVRPFEHEVEKGSAFALGLLAVKPEHQQLIVDHGALPHLVDLLKRHTEGTTRAVTSVVRRAADAITNLAHENSNIKTLVRREGGIPPLVELLEFADTKVQRAAAGALRTLAFKNDENKNQVGVIGNLVHSSPNIKKEVLAAGAIQPVIGLLSSCCSESQREAALLLGQFAATDSDCKVHIVQRGAVGPLIEMLQSSDVQLREMSAFALGRVAQDPHNQAGIAHNGGLIPLLKLLDSKNGSLQHNAAFALYGLADNEDNVSDFIRVGGVQKLQDGEFIVQATKDCVAKTLKRLEEKIQGRVLKHLLYIMRVAEKIVQRRVALALAHLCAPDDQRLIFVDNGGLELLLGLLGSANMKQQLDGAIALYKLANKAMTLSPVDAAPPSPTPQVYLGEQYVNNATLSDVTFLVEGRRFYAHRICLLASSDAFRAMFDGGYREKDARDIEIPNIRWEVFELMMRFIYTGSVNVALDVAQDLLRAADQYLLEALKRLCEYTIAQDISLDNVASMYELSESFHAFSLRHTCILFILEHFDKLSAKPRYVYLVNHIVIMSLFMFTSSFLVMYACYVRRNSLSDDFVIRGGFFAMDSSATSPKYERRPFSIKLWPPSDNTRQMLVARVAGNLSSQSIFAQKYGTLGKEEAEENAKRIEAVAFKAASQQYDNEPDGDGGSAVQLYAKECSKLILDVLKRGPVPKEDMEDLPSEEGDPGPKDSVEVITPPPETFFDISKGSRSFIEAEETEEILKPLKKPGNSYSKICFSNRSFSLEAARVAAPVLESIKDQLKEVDLSDFIAGRPEDEALEVMTVFSTALEGSILRSLNLSDNALGEKGVRAFEALLKSQSCLEELYLMNNGISEEAARAVCELIPSTETLKVLRFHNNMTGDEGALAIAQVLKRCPLLEDFQCSSTRVGAEGGAALAEALESCTKLKTLDLRDNMFGTEAAVALAKAIPKFPSLSEIYLCYLNLEDEGATVIADALKDSAPSLEVFDMMGNDITIEAVPSIAACIASKQNLKKLNLDENELKDEGAVQIAKALETGHSQLKRVDVNTNAIGRAGARVFAKVVLQKPEFELLNINANFISDEGIDELKEAFEKCPEKLGPLDENDPDGVGDAEESDEEDAGDDDRELDSKLKHLEVNEEDE
ncbi:unnamed protein product [Linum tenue]|uniref:BTB domain-containing protein n=1 Tax=Linum tenue TaxID=586396 RepID=A0AAV0RQJ0_9ROSI|nr:unnamed protein product [Linum tenue]